MKELIEAVSVKRAWVATIVFLALVGPVFIAIYLYKPSLLVSLDIAKLILLCVSVSLPLLLANAVAFFFYSDHGLFGEEYFGLLWIVSAVMAGAVLNLSLALSVLGHGGFRSFIFGAYSKQLILMLVMAFFYYHGKRKKANQSSQPTPGS